MSTTKCASWSISMICLVFSSCIGGTGPVEPVDPADNPLAHGSMFVPIPRDVDNISISQRVDALTSLGSHQAAISASEGKNFYLAIKRSELGKKMFMNAYLEQYFLGSTMGVAATTLGTRVVEFRLQNGKLYVFDVDGGKQSSSIVNPDLIIDAYPVVLDFDSFNHLPGSGKYILVDPAAGLNRFGVVGDAFSAYSPVRFIVELSFLQNAQKVEGGISYEHVFVGYAEEPISPVGDWPLGPSDQIETNPFRASGTLVYTIRKYQESPNFVPVELPEQEHYFRTPPRVSPDTGQQIEQQAAHWNIYPGMKPIEWVIGRKLAEIDNTPPFADYNLVGAVRAGIEGWNQAFGFDVFTTRLAEPDERFGRDDLNFLVFDPDPSKGYAFADMRVNPKTGEIYGSNVYFGAGWLDDSSFEDDPEDDAIVQLPAKRPPVPSLVLDTFKSKPLCVLWAPEHLHQAREQLSSESVMLTKKEKFEKFITHVIAHEIGHTLGLRHNFKGSLIPPSSSVMDYLNRADSVNMDPLGSYDIQAVNYLYGLSGDLPMEPFCTDPDTVFDPDCAIFDTGADPLFDFHVGMYRYLVDLFLTMGIIPDLFWFLDPYSEGVLGYVRAGGHVKAHEAWVQTIAPLKVPIPPEILEANPNYGPAADAISRRIFELLFLVEWYQRNIYYRGPNNDITDPELLQTIIEELKGNLLNLDGVRSFKTRRTCVDVLKTMQDLPAYLTLLDVQEELMTQIETGIPDPVQEALLMDLVERIKAAISPYFN